MLRIGRCCLLVVVVVLAGWAVACPGEDEREHFDDVGVEDADGVDDVDTGPEPNCDDGRQSGQQTGVDCGGPNCPPCELGQGCELNLDCQSGFCEEGVCAIGECDDISCASDEICYRGGCRVECDADQECENDERCFEGGCAPLDCSDIECRDDETCDRGGCYPSCEDDADCGEQQVCNEAGACVDPCDGVECSGDEQCHRGVCYAPCEEDDDCESDERCTEDTNHCAPVDCEGIDCAGTQQCYRGVCYEACSQAADCDDELACLEGACVDPCAEADCAEDQGCYRGVCYPGCNEDADCDDEDVDERCVDDTCVPTDCDGVECLGGEACYYGECLSECGEDADCDGEDAVCATGTQGSGCISPCFEDETGQEVCPALDFETLAPSSIGASQATLHAEIHELPRILPEDHGFCWSTDPEPAVGDADCEQFGAATTVGEFSHEVDGLSPGQRYYGRPFVEGENGEPVYGEDAELTTAAPAVEDVQASQGTSTDYVEVTWEAADGALDYRVYRDGNALETVDAPTTSFEDQDATSPGQMPAPDNVTATEGDHAEMVRIEWDEPEPDEQVRHDYGVVAVYPQADSPMSQEAEGWLAGGEVTGYEVNIGGEETVEVGADVTSYEDHDAPEGSVDPGYASASEATSFEHVLLELREYGATPGEPVNYRVRALTDDQDGQSSGTVDGWRSAGEVSIQWEVSAADSDDDYSEIPSATTDEYEYEGAPTDGEGRYYQAAVGADGVEEVERTDPDYGYRAVAPGIETDPPTEVGTDSATLHGRITDPGQPEATSHGFCIDTSPDPSVGDGDCIDLGPVVSTGDFSEPVEGLVPGRTHYVRAYATTDAETAYGDELEFTTDIAAPTGLTATTGTESEYIELNWESVPGAESYEIIRDDTAIAQVEPTEFQDYEAQEGDPPAAPDLEASPGTHGEHVLVQWSHPDLDDGDPHDYQVVALGADADSDPSAPATGYRAARAVSHYELLIDGGDWTSVGDTTDFEHTGADRPVIEPGEATATDGVSTDYVEVDVQGLDTVDGDPSSYRVRAVDEIVRTGEESDERTGYRGAQDLEYAWYRSSVDADVDFSRISDWLDDPVYQDEGAPDDGTGRYYYAEIDAAGADSVTTDSDRGFRAAVPEVSTEPVEDVTDDSATLHGEVTALGAPDPDEHGFCVDTSSGVDRESVECDELGAVSSAGSFSMDLTDLDPGATYYVRAFAENDAGTGYGEELSFTTIPEAPQGLVASDGTSTEYVELNWEPAEGADSYRVYRDESEVATVTESSYDDEGADAPSIEPGTATASEGEYVDYVQLDHHDASTEPGDSSTYMVRAQNDGGLSGESNEDDGYIGVGDITRQWQRSSDDSDADYSDLIGATEASYQDETAPDDGSVRYYRVEVDADGAASRYTDGVQGGRAAYPEVVTHEVTDIEGDEATFHGDIEFLGVPEADQHGFCLGEAPEPVVGDAVHCSQLGEPGTEGDYQHTVGGLGTGTEYYVQAYATSEVGTVYGGDVSFVTRPAQPENLGATAGGYTDHVELTWEDASDGDHSEFRIYRDTNYVETVSQTSWTDEGADEGSTPDAPPNFSATDGDHSDRVVLEWDEPDVDDGDTHTYEVVATNETGDSDASEPDDGYRRGYPVAAYQVSIDGSDWDEETSDTEFDDTGADAPEIDPGVASATEGKHEDYVVLEVEDYDSVDGDESTYRVRAVNDTGIGEATDQETGYRGMTHELSFQWERSSEDGTVGWVDIDGGTGTYHEDGEAPADGEGRWYRVEVDAEGADAELSDEVRGARAAPPYAYTASSDGRVFKVDANGHYKWSYEGHDDRVYGVATDADGYVYTASADNTVKKIDSSGEKQWEYGNHDDDVRGVAVDPDGNVYTASADEESHKISSGGAFQWSYEAHNSTLQDVTVDADGNVFTVSNDDTVRSFRDGGDGYPVERWEFNGHGDSVYGVAVDAEGYAYSVSGRSSSFCDCSLRKIDPEGDQVWSYDLGDGDIGYGVSVDPDGYVYTGDSSNRIRKFDDTGEHVDTFTGHSSDVRSVEVGAAGFLFGGSRDNTARKFDMALNNIWTFSEHASSVWDFAPAPGSYGAFHETDAWQNWEPVEPEE